MNEGLYRLKQPTVRAFQWRNGMTRPDWAAFPKTRDTGEVLLIEDGGPYRCAQPGDYVIQTYVGAIAVLSEAQFNLCYEPVEVSNVGDGGVTADGGLRPDGLATDITPRDKGGV